MTAENNNNNYSTWLTKQQAAEQIGVTTKSVERFVQAGQIQQARWQRHGRGPLLAVYHPDDVARIAKERQPGPPAPFVVPGPDVQTNGNGHAGANLHLPNATSALATIQTVDHDPLRAFATAVVAAVMSQTSETLPRGSETLFVTIAEASAATGLTQAYLRRLIDEKTLPAVRDRGWRIRRKDLEAL